MDSNIQHLMGMDVEIPQIKLRRLDTLVPYYRNTMKHPPSQLAVIERLMLEFGFTNTVLIDDVGIVAGHGRCMATEQIYKRGEQIKFPGGQPIPIGYVPTLDVSGWSPEQRRAYIIADNQSARMRGVDFDEEMLKFELRELDAADFDLTLTAFDEDQLDQLLADVIGEVEGDPDATPDEPENPYSVPGDVWVCGPHRVMCGNATCQDDWDRLMQGERADVCWTDPPYNVDVGRKNKLMEAATVGTKNAGKRYTGTGDITGDKIGDEAFEELIAGIYAGLFSVMKPGATIYVAHSDKEGARFRRLFEAAGFHFSQILIWKKNTHVLGMADFQPIHEPVIYGWKKGSRHRWYGGRKNTTVMEVGESGPISRTEDGRWCIKVGDSVLIVDGEATLSEAPSTVFHEPKPEKSGLHASQKPVNLIERMLRNSSRAGDLLVDACGGSGATLIAADRLGMSARLMEIELKFTDVIVRRWQDYTGRRAVHAGTGEQFPEGPEVVDKPDAGDPLGIDDLDLDTDLTDLF